jgi:hypothetical protein
LWDTNRGTDYRLFTDTTAGENNVTNLLTAFNSSGFSLGSDGNVNGSGQTFASWTFREQPKFFDVVAGLTSDSSGNLPAFNHSLASVPGCVFLKATNSGSNWVVYHRGLSGSGANQYIQLNSTNAATNATGFAVATSTTFQVAAGSALVPDVTYVAYLFAHNAGGFGLTGTDNVISCGSFTTDGSGAATVTLGYEPQWVMIKRSSDVGSWQMFDTMRGMPVGSAGRRLDANSSNAESTGITLSPTATGFAIPGTNASSDFIYIAIRRGPMKVPTDGTKVFTPITYSGDGANRVASYSPINVVDLSITGSRTRADAGLNYKFFSDRLRGPISGNSGSDVLGLWLDSTSADSENGFNSAILNMNQLSIRETNALWNGTGSTYFSYGMSRAPSFMDVVCYTGTGTDDRQVTHNLGVAPELIICKSRSAEWPWWVGGSVLGSTRNGIYLNENGARQINADAFSTDGAAFTSSYFLVSSVSAYPPNASGYTNVAYLFATCPGVSKVGSYTGNGATQAIACGFTGGARFVLIKRTDATGGWYVYDTARGMTTLTDPYLFLNNRTAETATLGSVTTTAGGFTVDATILSAINASGGTYIFLAIA